MATSIHLNRSQLKSQLSFKEDKLSSEANSLPRGFPVALTTHKLWSGPTYTDESHYVYLLARDQVLEIEAALAYFKTLGIDGDLVSEETFPLPTLRSILRILCIEVHNGKGFFVLRGLDLYQYSVADGMIIFLGIQSYIGEQKARQDDSGNMIVHIVSDSPTTSSSAKNLHPRHSKKSITFHTEETGDIIAWQTRNTAARGGRCIISSSHTIYNILATTRPDIIRILSEPDWPFALPHFHRRPILFYQASRLILNFCRAALLGSDAHPRPAHLPSLTDRQREALDVFESVARAVELKITTQPGDLHFVNNLAVLHRRDEFVDDAPVSDGSDSNNATSKEVTRPAEGTMMKRRHLVRMRIRNEKMAWELPHELKEESEKAFGVHGERIWHLEPMPEGFFPLRKYPL